jgi:formiminoglutamase
MDKLVLFNNTTLNNLLNKRVGESKFGEHVQVLTDISNIYEQLKNLDVTYVIIGLPEDVGVFANHGKLDITKKKSYTKARNIVNEIDKQVTYLIYQIILAGKKPIIIGGGHNNAYGNIKGVSLALKKPINVINFDAHSDFRPEEGRHSGNGFSYAYAEGFLKNYFIFGLHRNYTSDTLFKSIKKMKCIKYNTFEALKVTKELIFKEELDNALLHINDTHFGIEIDCDAIENIPSSAKTPSGFSVNKARSFVNFYAKQEHACYLHICEAAPTEKTSVKVGKLITYLITDFINAN